MYTPDFLYNPNDEDFSTLWNKCPSLNIEKWEFVECMDKLQTEISDIKISLGRIHTDLKVLTVAIQTLQIAIEHLSEQNH